MDMIKSIWPQTILIIASAISLGHSASASMIWVDLSNPQGHGACSKIQHWVPAATNSDSMLVPPGTNCDLIDDQGASITVKSAAASEVTTIDGSIDGSGDGSCDEGSPVPARVGNLLPEPDLPTGCESLAAPAGNRISHRVYAKGLQIYRWDDTTKTWVLVGPSAALYSDAGFRNLFGSHYTGPTWESNSGSTVVGHKLEDCKPNPIAIPWLLLEAVTSEGPGPFNGTTYIQRVATTGGLAPDRQGTTGETVQVPYTAQYYFYRKSLSN